MAAFSPGAASLCRVINSLDKSPVLLSHARVIEIPPRWQPGVPRAQNLSPCPEGQTQHRAQLPQAPCTCRKADSALERALLPCQIPPVQVIDTCSRTGQSCSQSSQNHRTSWKSQLSVFQPLAALFVINRPHLETCVLRALRLCMLAFYVIFGFFK